MKQEVIFFDFDGTIADTKSVYFNAIRNTLKFSGYKDDEIAMAIDIGLSLRKTLRKLGLGIIESLFIKRKITKSIKLHVNEIKKCKDISFIKEMKFRKILVTNSSKSFALPILKHLKLKKYFKEIYGAEDFDDKAVFLRDYIKNRSLNKSNCYYVGDRVADIILARKAGIKSIIISGKCAWNSKKEILKSKPDFIVNSLADVNEILEQH